MTDRLARDKIQDDPFLAEISTLPPLPTIIGYEDDYDEKVRFLKVAQCADSMTTHDSGNTITLNFMRFDERIRPLMRVFLLSSLQTKSARTVGWYFGTSTGLDAADIEAAAMCVPRNFQTLWSGLTASYSSDALSALKGLLAFLCEIRFAWWTPLHSAFVSRALPVKQRDRYASVRSGDAFLDIQEEAKLVRWLDSAALHVNDLDKTELELSCLVVCSYQFGMRPKQLGMIRKQEISIRKSKEDNSEIVHLTFRMVKQRDAMMSKLLLHRKVKREWAPLFVALLTHKESDLSNSFLFGFTNRLSLSTALNGKLTEILSTRRVAYDLRHSLAQRLVDAGASHEELASALGHTRLESSLVYFRATANQAEIVNKALGISDTYLAVAKIAATNFISANDLAGLKGDQQIAGIPHGIPIAGIGACRTGQPSCPYNPVTACYGCPKFMPVRDTALHTQVLDAFRSVVHHYKDVGRGETHSPAYLQLQRTISEVQGVIRELQGNDEK